MSSVSSWDSSSKLASTSSASLSSMFCRSNGFTLLQGPSNARRAAATARLMSSASPSATDASSSPVAGLCVSNFLPEAASTHLPSISIFL